MGATEQCELYNILGKARPRRDPAKRECATAWLALCSFDKSRRRRTRNSEASTATSASLDQVISVSSVTKPHQATTASTAESLGQVTSDHLRHDPSDTCRGGGDGFAPSGGDGRVGRKGEYRGGGGLVNHLATEYYVMINKNKKAKAEMNLSFVSKANLYNKRYENKL